MQRRLHVRRGQLSRWSRTLAGAALASFGLAGCANFWDNVTSRDFKFADLYTTPNPLLVLHDSNDGDKRAKAFLALHEPRQNKGTEADQEFVVKLLTTAVVSEHQSLCRLAAINALGRFKDPRAVEALKNAYYKASDFPTDTATIIQCEALAALGNTHNPAAVDLLATVVREPAAVGTEEEKQEAMDRRIAAARGLGNFHHYEGTEALVSVLRTDKNVALRDCVHQSLVASTGKNLPPDYKAWDDLLHQQGAGNAVTDNSKKDNVLVGWFTSLVSNNHSKTPPDKLDSPPVPNPQPAPNPLGLPIPPGGPYPQAVPSPQAAANPLGMSTLPAGPNVPAAPNPNAPSGSLPANQWGGPQYP